MRTNLVTGACRLLLVAVLFSLTAAAPEPKTQPPTRGTTTTATAQPDSTGEHPTRPDLIGEWPTTEERLSSEEKPTTPMKEDGNLKEDPYTNADFTKGNGTVEALLQELLMGNAPGRGRYSRALGCSSTPLYGTTSDGSAFVDFTTTSPWPCGVDITQLLIRHGSRIDVIQVTYKSYDGTQIIKDKHGEDGGKLSVIVLSPGERIITVAGVTDNTYLQQLTFVSRTATGEIKVHGPYGRIDRETRVYTFMVAGKINSIFGRSERFMNSIGFYYEAEGAHS